MDDSNIVQRRPAETVTGFGGAAAILVAYFLDVTDPVVYGAIGIVIAGTPAVISSLVDLIRRPR